MRIFIVLSILAIFSVLGIALTIEMKFIDVLAANPLYGIGLTLATIGIVLILVFLTSDMIKYRNIAEEQAIEQK